MKIAIDSGPLTGGHAVRGVGIYTAMLVKHLRKIKGLKIETVDFSTARLSKYDVAHYPYFHPFFITLPIFKKTKTLVTIHDLIPLIYLKHYPPGIKGRVRYLVQKHLIKSVDGIISVSETSKKDIVRFLGIPQEKIEVIHEAPKRIYRRLSDNGRLARVREKHKLPKKFVLYVGDVNYNKNILGLAKACSLAKTPLVIVGKQAAEEEFDKNHPENRSFVKFLDKYRSDSRVIRLGFVPSEDLVTIYNLAAVYCQPSFYEGFGLPVLEAMACGTPIVASKIQVHLEIAGDAAVYANPKKPEDLASKIRKVIDNKTLRQKLIKKGRKKVKKYSWEKTARETAKVYEKVIKRN